MNQQLAFVLVVVMMATRSHASAGAIHIAAMRALADETTSSGAAPASMKPCKDVSVVGDATYCIQGPVCSGKGPNPGGPKCPQAGNVAVRDCLQSLRSYSSASNCVAPVNASCSKLATGAWGCVWEDPANSTTTATSLRASDATAASVEIVASNGAEPSPSSTFTGLAIGGVMAVAIAVGVAIIKKTKQKQREYSELSPRSFWSPLTPERGDQ